MHPVIVTLGEGYFTTATARQHTWHADIGEDGGGDDAEPNPEELLLGALGSCMAQTAKLYAARKGWEIDFIKIELEFERFRGSDYAEYDGDANFVHEIRENITIEGDLDEKQIARIREIMGKCPVRRLIGNPVFFKEGEEGEEEPMSSADPQLRPEATS